MSYQDVKRIHTKMALREPLADALKALDKTLRDLIAFSAIRSTLIAKKQVF